MRLQAWKLREGFTANAAYVGPWEMSILLEEEKKS